MKEYLVEDKFADESSWRYFIGLKMEYYFGLSAAITLVLFIPTYLLDFGIYQIKAFGEHHLLLRYAAIFIALMTSQTLIIPLWKLLRIKIGAVYYFRFLSYKDFTEKQLVGNIFYFTILALHAIEFALVYELLYKKVRVFYLGGNFVERNDPIPYVFYFLFIFVWYMISLVSDHYK